MSTSNFNVNDADALLHQVYLPVTAETLGGHFLDTSGGKADVHRHLKYYERSLEYAAALTTTKPRTPSETAKAIAYGRQLEKDERFWGAAALLGLFYPEPRRVPNLSALLERAGLVRPPWDTSSTWTEQLAGELHLYFEVNLPAPLTYKEWLADHLDERVIVPYIREATTAPRFKLEGATKVDAMLLAPGTGCSVVFEVKVLSDASPVTRYDVLRNQIARTIDVTLESGRGHPPLDARNPERTCVVLLTPDIFRERPESRLYGRILREYQNEPSSLGRDLPHRALAEGGQQRIAARLGWATFNDCRAIAPQSCGWLAETSRG
jgi:hypothetical protein